MATLPRSKALEAIRDTKGKFFTVTFTKRTTGEKRTMNCRINVKKGVKGVGLSFDPVAKGLLPVFEMKNDNFRMINLDTIDEMTFEGRTIQFVPDTSSDEKTS